MRNFVRSLLARRHYALVNLRVARSTKFLLPGHLMSMFAARRVNCVLDVGANRGDYGAMLRASGYAGRIVSFEPASRPFEEVRARAAADRDWQVRKLALGAAADEAELNVFASMDLNSFLRPNALAGDISGGGTRVAVAERVSVRTLDSEFDAAVRGIADPRVFLKLDTQGFDLEVLRGARESLPRVIGLQSEVSFKPIYDGAPRYAEALAYYESLGFRLTGMFNVVEEERSGHVVEMDAVLFR